MNINKIVFCHRLKANYQISYCIRFNVHGQVRSLLDGFSFRTVNEEIYKKVDFSASWMQLIEKELSMKMELTRNLSKKRV